MRAGEYQCQGCGWRGAATNDGQPVVCAVCAQTLSDAHFVAHGADAMLAQTEIVIYHQRMATIRAVAAYGTAIVFAIIAAVIVVFAPESRSTAANIFATAFLVMSAGIAGYTRFSAKVPGMEIKADNKDVSQRAK